MAEIIGTVASILQLVDTALKAREYIQDFRHAPEEQRSLLSEMESLSPLLTELQARVKNNKTNNTLQQMHKPLTAFEETMKEFTEKLKSAGLLKNFVKRVQWTLWSKKESKEYLERFEQFKTMLNGWLLLDVWDQQQSGRAILQSIAGTARGVVQQQGEDRKDILKSVKDAADARTYEDNGRTVRFRATQGNHRLALTHQFFPATSRYIICPPAGNRGLDPRTRSLRAVGSWISREFVVPWNSRGRKNRPCVRT
ncbi:hypothetical protein B0H11DRAFT_1257227 [Mycena galericulata]|nr:hypothetical protein B0H11DRAFT_1257227 [Mycena galericulata]